MPHTPPPDALMSYTRFDDQHNGARLTDFRTRLSGEVRAYTGRPFHIFQDTEDIKWGEQFAERIDEALAAITFFIPILTPSFFNSTFCRYELEEFLAREQELGRSDLVLPVYYIEVAALEDKHLRNDDPLAQTLAARQRVDWRELRFESFDAPQVRRTLAQMAQQIARRVVVQGPDPQPQGPDPQPQGPDPQPQGPDPQPREYHPAKRLVWMPEVIEIPAGPFLMGSSDADLDAYEREKPQHELELPTYYIGRTPVTNEQFRPFVESDGYANPDYWTKAGWQWCCREQISAPCFWNNEKWNSSGYPVVGISWYEAVAYARWLEKQTDLPYRLPTEAEWEKAARGPDGRIWPWGNRWESGRCNSKEAGKQSTTAVDSYPDGASPYGILDMVGNVKEWCATRWTKKYPYRLEAEWTEQYLTGNHERIVRGGSRIRSQGCVRGAFRGIKYDPGYRSDLIGLRIARYPTQTHDERGLQDQ
jgi:formylglycine-generating enzyme required for sulfatase activity